LVVERLFKKRRGNGDDGGMECFDCCCRNRHTAAQWAKAPPQVLGSSLRK
jgi:hypothetical protein